MKVTVTIERDDDGTDESTSMGVSASGVEPMDVCRMLMAGAEMVMYDQVRQSLMDNGVDEEAATYGAPMRTRLLALEVLISQEITPYNWVRLDMGDTP